MPKRPTKLEILLVLEIVVVIAALVCRQEGGHGDFSRDTFACRSNSYYCIASFRIYRTPYKYHRNELADFLVENGYWYIRAVSSDDPLQWLLSFDWEPGTRDGESTLFRQMSGGRKKQWIQWTKDNPEMARVLWPKVLSEMRTDRPRRYNVAGDMLQYARAAKDVDELQEIFANSDLQ